jgi:hypothetical protein
MVGSCVTRIDATLRATSLTPRSGAPSAKETPMPNLLCDSCEKRRKANLFETVKTFLLEHGWSFDSEVTENASGELRAFVHPETGAKLAWLDAINAQMDRESSRKVDGP